LAEKIDAAYFVGMSQAAPIARYGTADYHTLAGTAILIDPTPASLKALQAIMDQVKAGGVCFYRDALGGMLVCALDPGQSITVRPPWNREPTLNLTEVADLTGAYVAAGSAQGYQTLVAGRRPPLDTSERLL
jgi:hypothetical protein